METIEIKGQELLSDSERKIVEEKVKKYSEKIRHWINNDFYLRVLIRAHNKNEDNKNKRKKYSIDLEISGEIPRMNASAFDWDLSKALNGAFQALLNEIEHRLHVSEKS
jgi:ribosome-associated translation inhibitor RaiA